MNNMTEIAEQNLDMNEIVKFPIHFNVPTHYLKVDDFTAFSNDVKKSMHCSVNYPQIKFKE
jgi:hypothetical protein